jgi:hypothetical protein
MAAFRAGRDSVDHHREVLKLAPDFHDAELTIGLMDYVIGSLPLPVKMLVATMGVRGSKKRGLQELERVAVEGKWARDVAHVLLVDLYKREKRWKDAIKTARQIVALKKSKSPVAAEEKELQDLFASLSRDKTLDSSTRDLVQHRWTIARQQLEAR